MIIGAGSNDLHTLAVAMLGWRGGAAHEGGAGGALPVVWHKCGPSRRLLPALVEPGELCV